MSTTPIPRVRGINFESKSKRKARRKGMIRAEISNRIAEARMAAADRREFYRHVRQMKQLREMIARETAVLAQMADAAVRKAGLIPSLVDEVQATTAAEKKIVQNLYAAAEEVYETGQHAAKALEAAAADYAGFSRRTMFYINPLEPKVGRIVSETRGAR